MADELYPDCSELVHLIAPEPHLLPENPRTRGAATHGGKSAILYNQSIKLAECRIAIPDDGRKLVAPYCSIAIQG